jgi:hypothetical protein
MEVLLAGLAGLALIGSTYTAASAWADLRHARRQAAEMRQETEADRERLRVLEARGGGGADGVPALLSADAPPPRVLADLAAVMPGDVRLESLALTYGQAVALEMQVVARAAPAYDAFLQRLEGSPAFTDVTPGDESRGQEVRGTIRVLYRPAGPERATR